LREAIEVVNSQSLAGLSPGELKQISGNLGNNDTIFFDWNVSQLWVVHGELLIEKDLTVSGAAFSQVPVVGILGRVFEISAGATVTLTGLAITKGFQIADGTPFSDSGGGILNHGTLTLSWDTIQDNQVLGTKGSRGCGGGLYNDGSVTMQNVIVQGNSAEGGTNIGLGGFGEGGGVFNANGHVVISQSQFQDNVAQGGVGVPGAGLFASGNGEGGGLFNSSGDVSISDQSIFKGNFALGGGNDQSGGQVGSGIGGGLYNEFGVVHSLGTWFDSNGAVAGRLSGSHFNGFDFDPIPPGVVDDQLPRAQLFAT
jgi:hypothetical protein